VRLRRGAGRSQAIDTSDPGSVTWSSAEIDAPFRSAPPLTVIGEPAESVPEVPPLHVMVEDWSSPPQAARPATASKYEPLM